MKKTIILALLLSGCATGYNPNNATTSAQDQSRNHNPDTLHCPRGSVKICDIEGGVLVGKAYSNCRCEARLF